MLWGTVKVLKDATPVQSILFVIQALCQPAQMHLPTLIGKKTYQINVVLTGLSYRKLETTNLPFSLSLFFFRGTT